jgi:hypothetical protein
MEHNDDKPSPPETSNDLLDELESIRGLLDDSIDDDEQSLSIDIPILNDVVPAPESPLHADTELLDLQHIFDEPAADPKPGPFNSTDATSPSLDSTLAGMALDDLELTEFGLEGLDLDNLDIDIEIPDFKLQAEISDPEGNEQPAADPIAATASTLLDDTSDLEDLGNSLAYDLALLDEDPELWLEDDPIADTTDSPSLAEGCQKEQEELFAEPPASADSAEPPIDLEFLIQDIVDEFIPQIEDQLRRRLSDCSAAVIQQLAEKHLKK